MARSIRLSPDVSLPLDAVTQTFAILGKRGSGKTNTAGVLTEQLIKAGLPVVYVDPIGVTWGLRHSRDGRGPGLPVVILGGEHADVPLEETGGAVIADFLIEHRAPAVLDLGSFSKSAQRRFMVDFTERLYHKNRDALHVALDECDTFVPQRIDHGGERLVGAVNDLVRKGRARGIGVTLISQRPALISKDVLTQVETLVAHRMTGPQDRDAIERWIEHNATGGDDVLASLQLLEDGEAWVWSPSWLKVMERTRVSLRETFDSSATPKAGERVVAPKRAAEVDLAALRERLSATIEKAKADDPRELRRRIAELEKRKLTTPAPADPALSKEQERVLDEIRDELTALRANLPKLGDAVTTAAHLVKRFTDGAEERFASVDSLVGKLSTVSDKGPHKPTFTTPPRPDVRPSNGSAHRPAAPPKPVSTGAGEPMKGGYRRILLALARYGECSKTRLAILTRYASNGGGFNNYLSDLRKNIGYITGEGEGPYAVTDAGLRALGGFDPLPEDPAALFDDWLRHPELKRAHREIMRVLKERGRPMMQEDVAAECVSERGEPYDPEGGGFNNAVSRLRTLGVIEGKREIALTDQLRGS